MEEETKITFCYEFGGSLEEINCSTMTEARGLMTEATAKGIECYIHIK
jgi:hypothetical protein